ncbi:MAG: hypothetical protein L0Y58_05725 [Verrucomicrobia subdivision 3 bacterium]|nr:hypothetical protein [Limisphaerales bacterium]
MKKVISLTLNEEDLAILDRANETFQRNGTSPHTLARFLGSGSRWRSDLAKRALMDFARALIRQGTLPMPHAVDIRFETDEETAERLSEPTHGQLGSNRWLTE